jgi:predicted GNAT family acetyltransferase
MISYRQMVQEDVETGLQLCRQARWNQLERDWAVFLKMNPRGCFVADKEGKVVGTVATLCYESGFSWIGMVLVDQAYQRQGIGIQLLRQALEVLKNEETVKLDATPEGREVYLKLDFIDEYPLSRMRSEVADLSLEALRARPIVENDLPALVAFDYGVFGADRKDLLKWMWRGASPYGFVVESGDEVAGYCLGREGYNYTHIGPVAARNFGVAKDLVSAALNSCAGRPVILDAVHFDKEWLSWLATIGFKEQRKFVRMYRGTNRFPGNLKNQFAILGPEFG